MSSFLVLSGAPSAISRAQNGPAGVNDKCFRPVRRLTCAALVALAVAGCSQEVQRFDPEPREARTAKLHYNEERYAEGGFASWRRGERGDFRAPNSAFNRDPVTRSLPYEAEPRRSDSRPLRERLEPEYQRAPRAPRRSTHTVRAGDTLYSISRSHDVNVEELARINELSDPTLIRIGDTLYIPEDGYSRRAQRPDRRRAARGTSPREEQRRAQRPDRQRAARGTSPREEQRRAQRPDRRRATRGTSPREEQRRAQRTDRRRATRGAPRREEQRRAPRDRRDAERRPQRHSNDELYVDPLLRDRDSGETRRQTAPRRRTEEHSTRESRSAERQPEPRRERISSASPQRAAPATQPPAPAQRPQSRQRNRIAQTEERKPNRTEERTPQRTARAEPKRQREVGGEQKTSAAGCEALMKNPPARSGANFRRPVNGLIISRFGEQSNGQRNDGINISVPRGTPVKAAENGVVVYAGDELTGLGKLVLVRHANGWVSAYAHNDDIMVQRCDTVERGQKIARAGVSGSVTKPQLHFELRKNARAVDPQQHLAGTS